MRRFAIEQGGKTRVCDDLAENLTNASTNQRDKLRTQRADFPARAAKILRQEYGGDGCPALVHGCDDQQAAYRRVPVATPQYAAVALWHPGERRVVYALYWGCLFGPVASVLYFNAVPAATTAMARRLLGVVCDHYFDDFNTVQEDQGTPQGRTDPQGIVGIVTAVLGFPFALIKHVGAAASNAFLGVVSDLSHAHDEGRVLCSISERRRDKLTLLIADARSELTPQAAASLAGKLLFYSCSPRRGSSTALGEQPCNPSSSERRSPASRARSGGTPPPGSSERSTISRACSWRCRRG